MKHAKFLASHMRWHHSPNIKPVRVLSKLFGGSFKLQPVKDAVVKAESAIQHLHTGRICRDGLDGTDSPSYQLQWSVHLEDSET